MARAGWDVVRDDGYGDLVRLHFVRRPVHGTIWQTGPQARGQGTGGTGVVADHPNKHIRTAIRYAEQAGWTVTKTGGRAHI